MFETIGTLFTIGFWAVAIFLFLFGVIMCIAHLISGNWWGKFTAVVAVILGVYIFLRMYAWFESIAWCLLASGMVFGLGALVGGEEEGATQPPQPPQPPKTSVLDEVAKSMTEVYVQEAIIEEAIRKSKE